MARNRAIEFVDNLLEDMRPKGKVNPKETVGASGTAVYGGFLVSNEKNAKLTGIQKYTTFSDILVNTSIVAAGVRYFLNLVAKVDWKVEPAEGSGAEGQKIAEAIEAALHDMESPWHRVVRRAAMFRFHGFSVHEWTAKQLDDGTIAFQDVAARPQITIERWDMDVTGKVHGIIQRVPQTQHYVYLPRSKCMHIVDDSLNDSPEGIGLLRHIVKPAMELERFEQLEGFGFEGDLRGMPIGRAPFALLQKQVADGRLSKVQVEQILQPMKDFISNHVKSPVLGLLLDSLTYTTQDASATPSAEKQWDMDVVKAGSTSQAEVAAAIERKQEEIARVLGVEQLLLGKRGNGSLALSRDKSNVFALIVDSSLVEIAAQVEADLVDPMMKLNGWDRTKKPTLKTESIAYRDIEQVTTALQQMAMAGAPLAPDDPAIVEVRDLLGISKPDSITLASDASIGGSTTAAEQKADVKTAPKPAAGAGAKKPGKGAPAPKPPGGAQGGTSGNNSNQM
jgi:alkylated DNA nucleotide flippase Atl1